MSIIDDFKCKQDWGPDGYRFETVEDASAHLYPADVDAFLGEAKCNMPVKSDDFLSEYAASMPGSMMLLELQHCWPLNEEVAKIRDTRTEGFFIHSLNYFCPALHYFGEDWMKDGWELSHTGNLDSPFTPLEHGAVTIEWYSGTVVLKRVYLPTIDSSIPRHIQVWLKRDNKNDPC